jgi:hypothetical protein
MHDRPGPDDARDGAVFATKPILPGKKGPPFLLAGMALAVGALVVVGALDGLGGTRDVPNGPDAVATAEVAVTTRTPRPARTAQPPGPAPALPIMAVDPRPAGSHLFIHGDVFSLDVIVVTVSLEDADGTVTAMRSVRLQGGSTAFRLGPNARFDVRFDVPDELMGEGVWVRANAYDARGQTIGSFRIPVVRPSTVVLGAPRDPRTGLLGAPARGAP